MCLASAPPLRIESALNGSVGTEGLLWAPPESTQARASARAPLGSVIRHDCIPTSGFNHHVGPAWLDRGMSPRERADRRRSSTRGCRSRARRLPLRYNDGSMSDAYSCATGTLPPRRHRPPMTTIQKTEPQHRRNVSSVPLGSTIPTTEENGCWTPRHFGNVRVYRLNQTIQSIWRSFVDILKRRSSHYAHERRSPGSRVALPITLNFLGFTMEYGHLGCELAPAVVADNGRYCTIAGTSGARVSLAYPHDPHCFSHPDDRQQLRRRAAHMRRLERWGYFRGARWNALRAEQRRSRGNVDLLAFSQSSPLSVWSMQ